MIPLLPDELAELLDDASPATDAATDAEVAAFLAEHTEASRPEILAGWVKALGNHFAAGASRHGSALSVTAGAMKEARAGYYPAQAAIDAITPMFLAEVAKPPISDDQGAARNGKVAASEFAGILAWAIGQARAANLDAVHERVEEQMSDNDVRELDAGAFGVEVTLDTGAGAWPFVDGATFILDTPSDIPALWGHGTEVLWAEGESLMIAAPLGLGKTTLGTLLMRAQLGLGDRFLLGHPVPPRAGRILYLAMDRPAQVARAMRRQFTDDERDVLAERLTVWKGPPPADVAKDPTLLARMADAAGAGTIYLDSVKDAAIGLSDDEVGAGYNRARQHLLAQGVQLCEQHHTVKRGAKGGPPLTVADVYGSAWITNGTGSIILLTGDPGDPIVGFLHLRAPADTAGPYKLIHDQAAGTMAIHDRTDLLELVKLKAEDGLTAGQAAAAIFDTGKPTASQTEKARRRLNKLVDSGELKRVDGGKGQGNTTAWFAT